MFYIYYWGEMGAEEKVIIVLSELTNTLYLATKKTKRELTQNELDLIKYKFEQDKKE